MNTHTRQPEPTQESLIADKRLGYEPGEIGPMFGRKSKTYGYRLLYRGIIKAVNINGRLIVPKKEIDRLLAGATVYQGKTASMEKVSAARSILGKLPIFVPSRFSPSRRMNTPRS